MPGENFRKEEHGEGIPSGAEELALRDEPEIEKFFNELTPAAVESMIAFDLTYLRKVRYLRPMMHGEMGKLWDKLEDEAKHALRRAVSPEECRNVLRRLEDFTFAVVELDSLIESRKKDEAIG